MQIKQAKNICLGILMLTMTHLACADDNGGGVSFSRSRVIYPAGEKAVSLSVTNHGNGTYLVQAGVSASPDKRTKAPFVVTPPLFRLEAGGENAMRIVLTDESAFPKDRESVFYFSGRVIPSAKSPEQGDGQKLSTTLSISMRSVMKLFYRPAGLKIKPEQAPGLLRFEHVPEGVRVINPTPYYQSFAQLAFDGRNISLDSSPSMVSPFSELTLKSEKPVQKVTWRVMDDFGGTTAVKTEPVTQ